MNELKVIKNEIYKPTAVEAVAASLGKPAGSPEIKKYMMGAFLYIQGNMKEMSRCKTNSLINSLIECATTGLAIDNRRLAYLVRMGDRAVFIPGYQGYIYKIKQAEPSASVTVNLVYKEDKFTDWNESGNAYYKHEVADSFNDNLKDIKGAYCYIKTDSGTYLEKISSDEIKKIRSKSKMESGAVWKEWEGEMIKKSVIRRAGKRNFMTAIAKLDAADNQLFDLKKEKQVVELSDTKKLPELPEDERLPEDLAEEGNSKPEDNIGLRSVTGKLLVKGKTGKFQKYEIDGVYLQTESPEFINELSELKGKMVTVTYTQTKSGKYINNTIETVEGKNEKAGNPDTGVKEAE